LIVTNLSLPADGVNLFRIIFRIIVLGSGVLQYLRPNIDSIGDGINLEPVVPPKIARLVRKMLQKVLVQCLFSVV
jgi:hypothetical protein